MVSRLVGFVAIFVCASGFALSYNEVQSKAKAAGWVAGPKVERKLGAQLDDGFGDVFRPSQPEVKWEGKASFDWRNVNGVNWEAPIMNQANCGSCVAFAAVGAMETQMNITRKTETSPWAYSPQHLFACGGGGCDTGWQPASAASFLKSRGVPDEQCFPYQSGASGEDMACSASCKDSNARSQKIVNFTMPTSFFMSLSAVKAALQKGPLMTTMMVYEDFLYYKSGVYKHVTGEFAGGHAVVIVGYNDAEQAFIVRNSWGDLWGEKGYFRIAYNDASGVGNQTWAFEVPQADGYVTAGVRDNEVLTGTVELDMKSTFTGMETLEWTLEKDDAPIWWGEAGWGKRVSIDTTQFEDGTYTLVAIAHHAGGTTKSQPRRVYVLNSPLKGKVEITNLSAGQVLSEPVELDIKLQASPIPFTKVVLKAKNLATGDVATRSTFNTLPNMKMYWRANYLPSGDYEVVLEGTAGPNVSVKSAATKVQVQASKK